MLAARDGIGDGVGHIELLRAGLEIREPVCDGAAGAKNGVLGHAVIVGKSGATGKVSCLALDLHHRDDHGCRIPGDTDVHDAMATDCVMRAMMQKSQRSSRRLTVRIFRKKCHFAHEFS
jgi:hypothetical protein